MKNWLLSIGSASGIILGICLVFFGLYKLVERFGLAVFSVVIVLAMITMLSFIFRESIFKDKK